MKKPVKYSVRKRGSCATNFVSGATALLGYMISTMVRFLLEVSVTFWRNKKYWQRVVFHTPQYFNGGNDSVNRPKRIDLRLLYILMNMISYFCIHFLR